MRRTLILPFALALGAAPAGAQPASASPPAATDPLGPITRTSASCISFDPARSAAPVKPHGWYAIGLSAPGQVPFQLVPRARLASWSAGLTPAHNDFVGDGFIGNTSDGPQAICLTDTDPIWYQGLYDATGNGPKPGTSGPGGGVGWVHYYGWSTQG
ncbi:MAG TPA: hypothetical protein VGO87_14190 [Acidimicrobiia bacterium]